MTIDELKAKLNEPSEGLGSCGHSCVVENPWGMATNGPCRHIRDLPPFATRQLIRRLARERRELRAIIQRVIEYNERSRDLANRLRESSSTHEEVLEADILDNICDNIERVLCEEENT